MLFVFAQDRIITFAYLCSGKFSRTRMVRYICLINKNFEKCNYIEKLIKVAFLFVTRFVLKSSKKGLISCKLAEYKTQIN